MSYTLHTGWQENRVTGAGGVETIGHPVRGTFEDDVPLEAAKAELRAICDREERELSERPGAAGGARYRPPRTT